jgi:hypothetical protein
MIDAELMAATISVTGHFHQIQENAVLVPAHFRPLRDGDMALAAIDRHVGVLAVVKQRLRQYRSTRILSD